MQQKPVNTLSPNNVRAQGATHAAAARRMAAMAVELSTHAARTCSSAGRARYYYCPTLTAHESRLTARSANKRAKRADGIVAFREKMAAIAATRARRAAACRRTTR